MSALADGISDFVRRALGIPSAEDVERSLGAIRLIQMEVDEMRNEDVIDYARYCALFDLADAAEFALRPMRTTPRGYPLLTRFQIRRLVACPECKAPRGKSCIDGRPHHTWPRAKNHLPRMQAAQYAWSNRNTDPHEEHSA